jgi:translation elongation factor EF-1beta
MSGVSVIFKIYAQEGKLDSVMKEIAEKLKPKDMKVEELAFGIKAIRAMFLFDNADSTSSGIEERLRAIEGVSELEVEEESLL